MSNCPRCRHANLPSAEVCGQCGADLMTLSALTLSVGLPAPMVEPIHTPAQVPDGAATVQAPKTLLLEEKPSGAFGGSRFGLEITPPPPRGSGSSVRNRRKSDGDGTAHALPGLPGHPMNDPQQNMAVTIPATARADEAGQPVPAAPAIRPKLVVLRGMKINTEYPLYEGRNMIGRFADKPVDIDLMTQESLEQIWCSRQHAVVTFERGSVVVEDLNSLNGTWVNGTRIAPKQPRQLKPGDILQVGTVQMKLVYA